jgi:hypothetical protein
MGVEGGNHRPLHPCQPAIGRLGLDPSGQQVQDQRVDIDVLDTQVSAQGLGDPGLPDPLGAVEHHRRSHTAKSRQPAKVRKCAYYYIRGYPELVVVGPLLVLAIATPPGHAWEPMILIAASR